MLREIFSDLLISFMCEIENLHYRLTKEFSFQVLIILSKYYAEWTSEIFASLTQDGGHPSAQLIDTLPHKPEGRGFDYIWGHFHCITPPSVLWSCDVGSLWQKLVEASWNVMAQARKPDFVFRRNGRVHLNRPGGVSSVACWQPRYPHQR